MKKMIKKLRAKVIQSTKAVKGGNGDKPSSTIFPRSWSSILD